ncbi:MAG TPA: alpha/beta hydrolase fold domain-containing protein [Bacteroidales bacterium]|nr:alpha/beta hydrolase fold domain-containing protein [Bacteroidales bacterium]
MKKKFRKLIILSSAVLILSQGISKAQSFTVVVDKPENGTFTLDPALPASGKYPKGTVVTVTANPDAGYVLDAGYYAIPGMWGQMYHESMESPFRVTVDRDMHIGVSFIEKSAVDHIKVTQDVVYAKPGVKTLKYDVYSPKGAKNLPCLIIIHGGGWVSNDENIMRGLARELTKGGKFVVFSIDYRWAGKADGDETGNTMVDLIDDVFGAIIHIREHAAEYGGDPDKIGLTGDSAGGHLSAACSLMADKIGLGGFGKTPGVFEFKPSYMPENKTIEQVRSELMSSIKAAAPSYGVFSGKLLNLYTDNPDATPAWKEGIAPISNIPEASVRAVPQYLTRGTKDPLIKDADVKDYVDALVKKGQRVEYVQVGGASHAFFDWKPDQRTKATFYKYGVYYAAEMKAFFEDVIYGKVF